MFRKEFISSDVYLQHKILLPGIPDFLQESLIPHWAAGLKDNLLYQLIAS